MLRGEDKIRLLGFTTLPTTRDATQFRDAWAPHTQTQRHGELALMTRPYPRDLILSYLFSDETVESPGVAAYHPQLFWASSVSQSLRRALQTQG
jgi:hypothetical protein